MKNTTLTTLMSLAVAFVGLGMAPATRAAFTTFLEPLQTEVTTRLETNEDPAQQKALAAADKALNKNSKTLQQDLAAFGKAVSALTKGFGEEDEALNNAANASFNLFVGEADAQIAEVNSGVALHTTIPKSLSNALAQVDRAYSNAVNDTNWAARVRALNLVFTKLKVARIQLAKSLKAPESLEGRTVNVLLKVPETPVQRFSLADDGSYDTGEGETGLWSYTRTGANTGTITLNPEGGSAYSYDVTFKSSKAGSLVGEGDVTGNITVK